MADPTPDNLTPEELERQRRFEIALNRHGYAFQHSILSRVKALREQNLTDWFFEAAEFPVEVRGEGTRIDLLLSSSGYYYWLLAECKRVNPAFADWVFFRAPHMHAGREDDRFVAEQITADGSSGGIELRTVTTFRDRACHVAIQVKTKKDGDPAGGSGREIEDAAGQVLKGAGGTADFLGRSKQMFRGRPSVTLVPVIFTTADLYIAPLDPGDVDPVSGEVRPNSLRPVAVPYLFYQYHVSPGIKHGLPERKAPPAEPYGVLLLEFMRTITVVNAAGIDTFLREFNPDYFRTSEIKT